MIQPVGLIQTASNHTEAVAKLLEFVYIATEGEVEVESNSVYFDMEFQVVKGPNTTTFTVYEAGDFHINVETNRNGTFTATFTE